MALLVRGQDLGNDIVETQLTADGLGCPLIVAGQQHHRKAQLGESFHGGGAGVLHRVGHGDNTHQLAVPDEVERRLARFSQGVRLSGHGGIIQGQLFEKRPVAGGPEGTVQGGPDAFSMDGGKVRDGGAGQAPAFGFGHNGRAQGVLRRIFHTGGGLQQSRFIEIGQGEHVGDLGFALGDGAGLVENDGIYVPQGFQRFGGFNQDAVFRALAGSYHNGYRGGKAQGAGAGDDQHRHGRGQRLTDAVAGDQPDNGCNEGDTHDHRHKDTGDFVGQSGNGGLGPGGILHQPDHLSQRRVLAHTGGPDRQNAGTVDRRGDDRITGAFVHRDGFPGEGRLVHGRLALHHHAIHRHGLAGPHQQQIPQLYLLHGNFHFAAVPQNRGRFGGQIEQPGNGLTGAALGAGLQEFAHGDKSNNHGR